MARPRKSVATRVIEGAQRSKLKSNEPTSKTAVGDPPEHLPPSAKKAWFQTCIELPHLQIGDRALLEMAAQIRGSLMDGEQVGIQRAQFYRQCLKDLGASPVDRTRLNHTPEEPEDPDDRFFE